MENFKEKRDGRKAIIRNIRDYKVKWDDLTKLDNNMWDEAKTALEIESDLKEEVGEFGWLEEEKDDLELGIDNEVTYLDDEFDLDFNSFMHHKIAVTVPWLIRCVSGVMSAGLGMFSAVAYMRSNFYYFEMGYTFASTIGQFLCWCDYIFHFDYIVPTKPWNRYDPNFTPFHGHEEF